MTYKKARLNKSYTFLNRFIALIERNEFRWNKD